MGFIYQNEALEQLIVKKLFPRSLEVTVTPNRGHSRSFGVKLCEFSNVGFIYQNEALEPVIPKNLISRSLEVT